MSIVVDNREILIYDKTIVQNSDDLMKANSLEVIHFIKLLKNLGSDFVEVDDDILKKIKKLPEDLDYVFRFKDNSFIGYLEKFKYIVMEYNRALELNKDIIENLKNNQIILEISIEDIDKIFMDENKKLFSAFNIKSINITNIDKYNIAGWDKLIKSLKTQFMVNVGFCASNRLTMATAISTEACIDGVDFVTVAFNGGDYGYAALEEVLLALNVIKNSQIGGDLKLLKSVADIYKKLTRRDIYCMKAVLGDDIFKYESGIHVDGIEKNSHTYEPFDPSEIGQKRKMYIGKHSGKKALMIRLSELNLNYKQIDMDNLLYEVREKSIKCKRNVLDEELTEMYENLKDAS